MRRRARAAFTARALPALALPALLAACAVAPHAGFEDPRADGRLSVRERALCEAPEDMPQWCDWPHQVRRFVQGRQACDHVRGEPWPEGASRADGQRRHELAAAMRRTCAGTDARLAALRAAYRDDADIASALAGFEDDVEP